MRPHQKQIMATHVNQLQDLSKLPEALSKPCRLQPAILKQIQEVENKYRELNEAIKNMDIRMHVGYVKQYELDNGYDSSTLRSRVRDSYVEFETLGQILLTNIGRYVERG